MKRRATEKYQDRVLKLLSGKADDFYLAGGTSLAKFYFQHRLSDDLDFFTSEFKYKRVVEMVKFLSGKLNKKIELIAEQINDDKMSKIMVYVIPISTNSFLKIDFVEDNVKLLKPLKSVDGIFTLSLEDIYLRKIYAAAGFIEKINVTGNIVLAGGRQEAKDFYDIYFLSQTFMKLSDFAAKYCGHIQTEGIVRWFRTYDRMTIKTGLLELKTQEKPDYKKMENHFKNEI
ncbi:MAG: nucleotidyl transferase AbiEii/AbiGii toxin family protein, partial [Elusimicrobia bacterium]|nr:nucleotidyl transferase AbiEii/AbiGii toxin family protein [Elusimicrobiota bacterium]